MAKPIGARCNLDCEYCYYTEKSKLYQGASTQEMSEELLERFIKDYIGTAALSRVPFTWHGGEPLLRPLSFYQKVVELQKKYASGKKIENCIQTNGTLLTDEFCQFFKDNDWLVGVSLDGPKQLHDRFRKNRKGLPSFDRVMKGVSLLDKHGVPWNAMATVNRYNADYPKEFYSFFKRLGCHYIQFTPVVERIVRQGDGRHLAMVPDCGALAGYSVLPEQWGTFLCTLFDQWVREDVGCYFIQLFESVLALWNREDPAVCTLGKKCGHAAVMEFNGDIYSCDHFVSPEYKLGNLNEKSLLELLYSPAQDKFGAMKTNGLPRQCRECQYLFACNGECPKNRFALSEDGEPGLNYLCKGYRMFFHHAAPYMDYLKNLLTFDNLTT